jgi:hypothetical protein
MTVSYERSYTAQEVDDIVLGSGADCYDWWRTFRYALDDEPCDYVFAIDSPDDEDAVETGHVTRGAFLGAMQTVCTGGYDKELDGGAAGLKHAIAQNDLDADDVDTLLQLIVFGEVVYG